MRMDERFREIERALAEFRLMAAFLAIGLIACLLLMFPLLGRGCG